MNNQLLNQPVSLIKDLKPNLKNLNLQVIVLDINKPTQTKDGNEVRSVRVADRTGSINLSVWNNYGSFLKEGDIIKLTGCYTQIWKFTLQLKISTKGALVRCGDFMMVYSEQPDMSILSPEAVKMIQEQQGGGGGVGGKGNTNGNTNQNTSNNGNNNSNNNNNNNNSNNSNVGNYSSSSASWR